VVQFRVHRRRSRSEKIELKPIRFKQIMSEHRVQTSSNRFPLIIGHRGSSAIAPENTMVAFKQSLADGADGIEFDVRLARDGALVVIHDATLKRTGRLKKRVDQLSSEELNRIDVGSWFNRRFPKKAKEEFSNMTVPTLKEVLDAFKNQNFQLYVEMKCSRGEDYKALASAVAQSIREADINKQIVVESFELAAIEELKRIAPEIRTAALFEPKFLRLVRTKKKLIEQAIAHGADEIALHHTLATRMTAKMATESGLKTVIWTTDNPAWVGRATRYGIKAIITNNPAKLLAARGEFTSC
jgi:glycerophosphoryl diester phosphodiesterase